MVQNFLAGGAAANVFAASLDVPVHVVDSGVAGAALEATNLLSHRVGPGTQSSLHGPAMTGSELAQALQSGADVTAQTQAQALAFGEMGIGNTASASLLAHKVTGLPLDSLIGRGTGIDTSGLARKRAVLDEAAARTGPTLDTDTALAEYAGFEMAMMVGSMQAAAEDGRIVLVDGFIATASAAAALIRAPHIRPAMVFCHRSQEAGHRVLLDWLSADPLLDMDMRLGEGTGALLAWPLVKAASAMLCDMASFDSAGRLARLAHARHACLCHVGRAIPDAAATTRARVFARTRWSRAPRHFACSRAGAWAGTVALLYWTAPQLWSQTLADSDGADPSLLVTGACTRTVWPTAWTGWAAGATATSSLEIMRDSQIGTYGALGLGIGAGTLQATALATARSDDRHGRTGNRAHVGRAVMAWALGQQGRYLRRAGAGTGLDRPLGRYRLGTTTLGSDWTGRPVRACRRWGRVADRAQLQGDSGGTCPGAVWTLRTLGGDTGDTWAHCSASASPAALLGAAAWP